MFIVNNEVPILNGPPKKKPFVGILVRWCSDVLAILVRAVQLWRMLLVEGLIA